MKDLLPLLFFAGPLTLLRSPVPTGVGHEATLGAPTLTDVSAEVDAVLMEYSAAYDAWRVRYRAAETDDDRRALSAVCPEPGAYAERLMALAAKGPKSDGAWRASRWIAVSTRDVGVSGPAWVHLTEHFIDHPQIGEVSVRAFGREETTRAFLRKLIEATKDRETKGRACYNLASGLKRSLDRESPAARVVAELSAESEMLYESIIEEFADVELREGIRIGDRANGDLYELRHLMPGKAAPDIEAEDVGGSTFKLSDYRGKVVMLDFWGHW